MSASGKKIGLALLGLVVLAGAAGWFVGVPMWEKAQAEDIRKMLAELPGGVTAEKIEVSLLNKSCELTDLKGGKFSKGGIEVSGLKADRVTLSGLNLTGADKPGIQSIADSVSASGLGYSISAEGLTQNVFLRDMRVEKITGDLAALSKFSDAASMRERFKALTSLHADRMTASGYDVSADFGLGAPVKYTADSAEASDVSMLKSGPQKVTGLAADLMGQSTLSIASFSLAGYSIPDVFGLLADEMDGKSGASDDEVLAIFQKEGFRFDNMNISDLKLAINKEEPLTLKNADFSLAFKDNSFSLQKKVSALSIPAGLYKHMDSTAEEFAKAYGKAIVLDGAVDLQMNKTPDAKNSNVVLKDFFIAEQNLGGVKAAFEASVSDNPAMLMYGAGDGSLKSLDLTLTDSGFLENLFAAQYAEGKEFFASAGINSAADLRRMSADEVRGGAVGIQNPDLTGLVGRLADLVEKSGTFNLQIKPATPLTLQKLGELPAAKAGEAGITSTYTAPAK